MPIRESENVSPAESTLQLMVKLAFIFGPFLVLFPILLRYINAVDNSFAFDFISIGIVVMLLAEIHRAGVEDSSSI